jgi:hypothetical protein
MGALLVLSAAVLESELRRLLLSPSTTFTFLLKLKTRKKSFGDDIPLEKL